MADEWLASLVVGVIDFFASIFRVFVEMFKILIGVLREVIRGVF